MECPSDRCSYGYVSRLDLVAKSLSRNCYALSDQTLVGNHGEWERGGRWRTQSQLCE